MKANVERARAALVELARALPEEREDSPIDRALDGSIVTAPEKWDPQVARLLDAVAARYLRDLAEGQG
jgi:5'-methylthioadenosine phosphorylase